MQHTITTPPLWVAALGDYLEHLGAGAIPASTLKLRSYQLRRFAATTGIAPFAIDPAPLIAYVANRDWSPATKRSARTTLRSFYGWAHTTGRMSANPALSLRVVPAVAGRPRPAPDTAYRHALRHAGPRATLMVMLAAQAGLRCREIAEVHTSDITEDLLGFSLVVHGKGGKVRVVPLNGTLASRLRRQPPGFVFPGQLEGHLSAHYVSKVMSDVLPAGVTAHQLRHRFASIAYAAERDIIAVQTLLGHASVATTQIYTAVPDGALRRAVDAAA